MHRPSSTAPGTRARARSTRAVATAAPLLAVALVGALAGCGGEGPKVNAGDTTASRAETGGTIVIATAAEPKTLMPPLANESQSNVVVDQIFDRLAEVGDSLNVTGDAGFVPRLARRWTWARDSLSIAFTIDSTARWHDGRPVRADDVRFTFDVYTDPVVGTPLAPSLGNIDSVSVQDSLTAVFWFKRRAAQQFFEATYHMKILPRHLLADAPRERLAATPFARNPVGTGRFRFRAWEAGQRVEIAADPDNYRGRAMPDRVIYSIAPDFGAATIRLTSGDADFLEQLLPETVELIGRGGSLRLVQYPSMTYGFLQFNLRAADGSGRAHPLFADRELRRALSMAIDRQRLVTNVYDSLAAPAAGPFPRVLFADWQRLTPIAHDVTRARAVLDSLGWGDGDGDGFRERGGLPLAFTVIVPTSSASRRRAAVLLQEQFKAVGARMDIEQLEINAFQERQRTRRFDATMNAWQTDPTPSGLRQTWGTLGARARGGSNYGAYESPTFDAAVDSALAVLDPARARAHWQRAFQTIIDDAPAVWLFEPRMVAGAHRRIRLGYLRPDQWWVHLADWWIPARDRIGRDRVGLR